MLAELWQGPIPSSSVGLMVELDWSLKPHVETQANNLSVGPLHDPGCSWSIVMVWAAW